MLKDPNNNEVTPYELLALVPDAPCAEVQKALPRFMRDRRNIARLGQAQEAVRKLQNAKARAAIDIWYYNQVTTTIDDSLEELGPPNLDEFSIVPVAPPDLLYCDLEYAVMETDFRQIFVNPVEFKEARVFDGIEDVKLRPHFDR